MNTSASPRPGSVAARHAGCICARRSGARVDAVDMLCPLHGIEPVLHDAHDALDALRPLTAEEQGELKVSAPAREA